jgi:predicted small lipoprotein YifL
MIRIARLVAAALILVLAGLPLAACGKKGPPDLPEGTTDQFPRQYPNPDEV